MTNELDIIQFCKTHPDWEGLLQKAPYYLSIKKQGDLVLLRYDIVKGSDFSLKLVRECRGIIIDSKKWSVVSMSFEKFGNYGESYVPDIDWNSARVEDKLDGSLIRLYYYNDSWRVSTQGVFDANECETYSPHVVEGPMKSTFGKLFWEAFAKTNVPLDSLNKKYTYTFELTSPYNRIVIEYDDTSIWHIGTRDMDTLQELDIDIGIKKPERFPITTLQGCLNAVEQYKGEKEGYVVVDKNWNRVKIKSPFYVLAHHSANNCISITKLVDIYLTGDIEEFLTYFPQYDKTFNRLTDITLSMIKDMQNDYEKIKAMNNPNIKELAPLITGKIYETYLFRRLRNPEYTEQDFFDRWLGYRQYLSNKLKEGVENVNI